MNGDVLAACVETLAARHCAVLDTPGAKYDRHRARLARFRTLTRRLGRFATLAALGDASTGHAFATSGPFALADHSSGPLVRMLAAHGYPEPQTRLLPRGLFGPSLARVRQAIAEIERRPSDDRGLTRFALFELMSRYLALAAHGLYDVRAVLAVDDFSADRLALLLLAQERGVPVGLMAMTSGERPAPPVPVALAICADERQAGSYPALARCRAPGAAPLPAPPKPRERYAVGVVFNGKADDAQIRAAHAALTAHPRVKDVALRLHPGFRPDGPLDGLGVADGGSLADFARARDVVVCGNSGSLIEIARLGTPVIFSDRIDHNPRDKHGFVGRGLVYEDPRPLGEVDFDAGVAFYASPDWRARLEAAYPPETPDAFAERAALLAALTADEISPA